MIQLSTLPSLPYKLASKASYPQNKNLRQLLSITWLDVMIFLYPLQSLTIILFLKAMQVFYLNGVHWYILYILYVQ